MTKPGGVTGDQARPPGGVAASHPERVYALVRALRSQALSRNRNFELHSTAEATAARRVDRFLRGVARDLERAAEVRLEPGEREWGYRLILGFPEVRLRRVITLAPEEHALLVEDPHLGRLLAVAA
jgi:hypothetical protein